MAQVRMQRYYHVMSIILSSFSVSLAGCDSNKQIHAGHDNQYLESSDEDELVGPAFIDSARITMKYRYEVEFIVRADKKGYAAPTDSHFGHGFELSEDYCEDILLDMDSLFVKKVYPVVVSKVWHPYIKETDGRSVQYDITFYSDGRGYHRSIDYAGSSGFYDIEYSKAFERMAQNLYVLGGPNTFRQ